MNPLPFPVSHIVGFIHLKHIKSILTSIVIYLPLDFDKKSKYSLPVSLLIMEFVNYNLKVYFSILETCLTYGDETSRFQ